MFSAKDYRSGNVRRMVSLQLCIIGWMYELIGTIMTVLTPVFHAIGIRNFSYVDALIMFVVIPFINLTNDETTKGIIAEQGWYQGVRKIFGIYNQVENE